MTLSGDFGRLQRLAAALEQGDSPAFRQGIMQGYADKARDRVAEAFAAGTNAHGRPWTPLKYRQGTPLTDTGALRGSVQPASSASQVKLKSKSKYAWYHQNGALLRGKRTYYKRIKRGKNGRVYKKKMSIKGELTGGFIPIRPIFPMDRLPDKWAKDFADISQKKLEDLLGSV